MLENNKITLHVMSYLANWVVIEHTVKDFVKLMGGCIECSESVHTAVKEMFENACHWAFTNVGEVEIVLEVDVMNDKLLHVSVADRGNGIQYVAQARDPLFSSDPVHHSGMGIARNIGREGEETQIMTLSELRDTEVDMFTTIFIGNPQDFLSRNYL